MSRRGFDAEKPLVWLSSLIKTPPFTTEARLEAGYLLGLLQRGVSLTMPHSRPMPVLGPRCHELRVPDRAATWRILYRVDSDAVVIADVFVKRTQQTPPGVIETARKRLREYDSA